MAEARPVALLIVDQHLDAMNGVEFLAKAGALYPIAKRILLVERDLRFPGGRLHSPPS